MIFACVLVSLWSFQPTCWRTQTLFKMLYYDLAKNASEMLLWKHEDEHISVLLWSSQHKRTNATLTSKDLHRLCAVMLSSNMIYSDYVRVILAFCNCFYTGFLRLLFFSSFNETCHRESPRPACIRRNTKKQGP